MLIFGLLCALFGLATLSWMAWGYATALDRVLRQMEEEIEFDE